MGGSDEGDASTARAEQTVRGLKTDSEDLVESYVRLSFRFVENRLDYLNFHLCCEHRFP